MLALRALIFCVAILISEPLFATSCDYSTSELKKHAKSPSEFFSLPLGSIAIGEDCDSSSNVCERNYVVTNCTKVEYATDWDDPSVSLVFNSSKNCKLENNCPVETTYIAVAAVHINNSESFARLPRVEVIRNAGWYKPRRPSREFRVGFSETIEKSRITGFFKLQAKEDSTLQTFEAEVIQFFHATPEQSQDDSWSSRQIFGNAFSNITPCVTEKNLCTLKAYLIKFSETPRGIPTSAVRINAAHARADGIEVRTISPIAQGIYNAHLRINFLAPN